MQLTLIDRLGNWNPQLFREIKGRLKPRESAIAVAISLIGQLLVFFSYRRPPLDGNYDVLDAYCRVRDAYLPYQEQLHKLYIQLNQLIHPVKPAPAPHSAKIPELGKRIADPEKVHELQTRIKELRQILKTNCPKDAIDIQLWWQHQWTDIFLALSVFGVLILLVVGTYMLISDFAQEERKGTLNFIRLSPQSPQSIFLGKILGVPVLLYLAAACFIPFHLWAGLQAQIPVVEILSAYGVVVASCAFFYSAALLFGLVSSKLGGFQSWLGSGAVLYFLTTVYNNSINQSPADWLKLFSPSFVLPYLVEQYESYYWYFRLYSGGIKELGWFYFPLGASGVCIVIFALLNYGLWTYWIWQALNRRFRDDRATIFSKQQSYLLAACFEVVSLGFAMQYSTIERDFSRFFSNLPDLLLLNGMLFLALIAALSPHRQALQDWARYKEVRSLESGVRSQRSKIHPSIKVFHPSVWHDLVWGEKSPATLAIALNLVINSIPVLCCILLLPVDSERRMEALSTLLITLNLIFIYAAIAQLMLMMKTHKRLLWAAGAVGATIVLPPMILGMLSISPEKIPGLWLFTPVRWDAIRYAPLTLVFQALLVQWSILGWLSWQLTRQLRQAGESASKALLVGRN